MLVANRISSHTRAWINEFLLTRGLLQPRRIPLFRYHITDDEFSSLKRVLIDAAGEKDSHLYRDYWGACYCLYVAERYRRTYDGSEGGWSWQGFDNGISVSFTSQSRSELVNRGLAYWGRPLRERSNGMDYLGTLFSEGGISWKLLQHESHGFSRAIRAGLRCYYQSGVSPSEMASVVREHAEYFPASFRDEEKCQLLASIIQILIHLSETYQLANEENPARYLSDNVPDWREQFPLPLDNENGMGLVNEWLKDAQARRRERQEQVHMSKAFTCEHHLQGDMKNWSLMAELTLGDMLTFKLDGQKLTSTRLDLVLFEGDRVALRLGAVFGRISAIGELEAPIHTTTFSYFRKYPELPLMLKCLSGGQVIHKRPIQDSEIDWSHVPLVFSDNDEWKLLGHASVTTSHFKAKVRMPGNAAVPPELDFIDEDSSGGSWYDLDRSAVLEFDNQRFAINLGTEKPPLSEYFTGALASLDTLPNVTYLGWPHSLDHRTDSEQSTFQINGQLAVRDFNQLGTQYGVFSIAVLGGNRETLLRRKIGVLPKDCYITSAPASSHANARIQIHTAHALKVALNTPDLDYDITPNQQGYIIQLKPDLKSLLPERLLIAVSGAQLTIDPVVIRLPYPVTGASLFDEAGVLVNQRALILERMLGMELVITASSHRPQQFDVIIELMDRWGIQAKRYYRYELSGGSRVISLYAWYEDILSMYSSTSDQDAKVRVRIESTVLLKQLDIIRYNAGLVYQGTQDQFFEIKDNTGQLCSSDVSVLAMQLSSPETEPRSLSGSLSQNVATGIFEAPHYIKQDGPWLLYPSENSVMQFRPVLIPGTDKNQLVDESACNTLQKAAQRYHPVNNANVFREVLNSMAGQFNHGSWHYLLSLKRSYGHLPLSAFEAWKALADHPAAIAIAVLRLEVDIRFAERLTTELSVIWERISLDDWQQACELNVNFLEEELGVDRALALSLVSDRFERIEPFVPIFRDFMGLITGIKSLSVGLPLSVLYPLWFNDLRRKRSGESELWPEDLRSELCSWIASHPELKDIADIDQPGFTKAVAYLPIYAAYMTAGKADCDLLASGETSARYGFRLLSDFDRMEWFLPVYSLVLSHLLQETEQRNCR